MSRTTTVDTVPAGEVSVAGASRPVPFIKRGTPQFMRVTLALFSAGLATFLNMNFAHWSFGTNRKPQLIRSKLKVKKATYYKLILYSLSASATATILSVDIQVRYTGNVK